MGQALNTAQFISRKKEKKDFKEGPFDDKKGKTSAKPTRERRRITGPRNKEIERAPPSSFAVLPLLGHMEIYLNKQ